MLSADVTVALLQVSTEMISMDALVCFSEGKSAVTRCSRTHTR